MAVNKVDYGLSKSEDTARNPSAAVWGRCPIARMLEDESAGNFFYDDFTRTALLTTPTITTQAYYNNGWKAFGSSGGTLLGANAFLGEGLAGVTNASASNAINFQTMATPFEIQVGLGAVFFEARIKVSSVTVNDASIFVGLCEASTLTAIVPITASNVVADRSLVGFVNTVAAPTDFNTTYKSRGVTAVVVETGVLGADCPTTTALAASTFVKLGMTYEPYAGPYGSTLLSFYVNGFRLATKKVIPSGSAGADFPNGSLLAPTFAIVNGSNGVAVTLTVDWVQAAQVNGLSLLA